MKMVPLKTSRRVLTWLCMCKPDVPLSAFQKVTCFSVVLVYFISMFGTFGGCAAFFIRFVSVDLTESLYALISSTASTDIVYGFIMGYINREKISMIFDNLSKIYQART